MRYIYIKTLLITFLLFISIIDYTIANDLIIKGNIHKNLIPLEEENIVVFDENDVPLGKAVTNKNGEFQLSITEPVVTISIVSDKKMHYQIMNIGEKRWKMVLTHTSISKSLMRFLTRFWFFLGPIFGGVVGVTIQLFIALLKRKKFRKSTGKPLEANIKKILPMIEQFKNDKCLSSKISEVVKKIENNKTYL